MPTAFCEGAQIIAVVVEAAGLAGFRDGAALIEQRFGQGDALCGDVFVDGGAGGLLENTAQIGRAHKKCADRPASVSGSPIWELM